MTTLKICLLHVVTLTLCWSASPSSEDSPPAGHLKPLGSHKPGEGVTMIGKFSSPAVFYNEFVGQRKPIWMRNALDSLNHVGLTNWTDGYLRKKYGTVSVNVEISKKENRKKRSASLTIKQFFKAYKNEDIYMVHSLRNSMEDLVLVPPTLACGGFQNVIQDAVLWLGSGQTMSVLHFDTLDNLLCLFDGKKDLVLIDPVYKDAVEAHGFVHDGGYSLVDVEKVDMVKFPRFTNVSWKSVKMRAGDCVYIPKGWYHQVTSSTKRHLAVNFWFSHLYWFNRTDCSRADQPASQQLRPISDFGFASPNEVLRAKLLDKLHDKGIMIKHSFLSSVDSSTDERKEKFFDAVNRYKDAALSWSELYGFDIDKAVLHFPDIFGLPGGSNSLPDDLLLYEPIVQPFAFGGGEVEEDEEEEEEDDNDDAMNNKSKDFKDTSSSNVRSSVEKNVHSESRLQTPDDVSVENDSPHKAEERFTINQGKDNTRDGTPQAGDDTLKKNHRTDEL